MPKFLCKTKSTSAVVTRPSTAKGAMRAKYNIRTAFGFNNPELRPSAVIRPGNISCYMSAPYMNARIKPASR